MREISLNFNTKSVRIALKRYSLKVRGSLVTSLLKKYEEEDYFYRIKSKIAGKKYKQFAFFLAKEGRKRAIEIENGIK